VFNYFIYKMVPFSQKSTMTVAKSKTEKSNNNKNNFKKFNIENLTN